jgi:DNA helicase-2/ATP-dependent DNA helicase PcrA
MFKPRPKQQEILSYTGGRMGVSAVPGSGKTQILSYLAAELIGQKTLKGDQEILVVTLVNSAVENFSHRVASLIQQRGLVPQVGYRVRTLHGLAHDIVRERPALAGLSDGFQIIDERAAEQILQAASLAWLKSNPNALDGFLNPELDSDDIAKVRRKQWPELVRGLSSNLIRQAKDLQISSYELRQKLIGLHESAPLLEMVCTIYEDYQRALTYRGAVDFNDLIYMALRTLTSDSMYLERLRHRWPFILEDEAQDSSHLQEEILRMLSGPNGNWVRVGDPNQAIFETFTTANPQYLRDFLSEVNVVSRELPNSGRSTISIIGLANKLIDWTQGDHPVPEIRGALTPPFIEPTPSGDPQPNPRDRPENIYLIDLKYTPQEELDAVSTSLENWLPDNQDRTVAVLVPTNYRGFELVTELKSRGINTMEILRSTRATREAAEILALVINFLADPTSPRHLDAIYRAWCRRDQETSENHINRTSNLLRKCRRLEDYFWPRADRDWLAELELEDGESVLHRQLLAFRTVVQRWQWATILPIDQLILTLAQDLFIEPSDLALVNKLAIILRRVSDMNPEWGLNELAKELEVIAKNERRFLGLSQDDTGFDPGQHKGEVLVATIHKAKGLEWNRVYLISVNNYDFPSGQPHDAYISEKRFVRGSLNLEAEALAQLHAVADEGKLDTYVEGEATAQARLDYAMERLRLLYVAVTRAKEELVITWNVGRYRDLQQATPFISLQTFWEGMSDDPAV